MGINIWNLVLNKYETPILQPSENAKKVTVYMNLEFWEEVQVRDINLGVMRVQIKEHQESEYRQKIASDD